MNKRSDIKAAVAAAFSAAAETYDDGAGLQREVAAALAKRIAVMGLKTPRVLEIGCGTGFLSEHLTRLNTGDLMLTDISAAMLARCRARLAAPAHFMLLDGENPATIGGGFDLICSSLAFQWFNDLPQSLSRLAACLAPGGAMAFATLGADSLIEWRAALAALGLPSATPAYPGAAALASMLPGLHIQERRLVRRYADGHAFLEQLKQIGAHLPHGSYRPLGPGALRSVLRRFETGIDVTYHVVYGMWRKP